MASKRKQPGTVRSLARDYQQILDPAKAPPGFTAADIERSRSDPGRYGAIYGPASAPSAPAKAPARPASAQKRPSGGGGRPLPKKAPLPPRRPGGETLPKDYPTMPTMPDRPGLPTIPPLTGPGSDRTGPGTVPAMDPLAALNLPPPPDVGPPPATPEPGMMQRLLNYTAPLTGAIHSAVGGAGPGVPPPAPQQAMQEPPVPMGWPSRELPLPASGFAALQPGLLDPEAWKLMSGR